ncbi:ABC transporter permease [Sphingomonas sp. H160509]|uniref:ABC transporter permease n=1 Tax=Sphingomonas sp. H160509 TaxID=2955313 RepID=UPI0020978E31|nr:ABC transporter permease [Sphingomonas sp. H160509]MDD1450311.1 ABC transporter permease [Sphingomonas sp. H160509]
MSALTSLYRSLAHHRLFALLNIGGLALGIATFLVLFLFVRFETGYDRVLPQQDRLWVMEERYVMPGYPADTNPNTMGSELKILQADYPQLVGTRYMNMAATVQQGGQATAEDLGTVDPNFFDLMRFPAVEGNPAATLADPNGLVVTQKTARKYFGSQSAIGRTLQLSIDGTTYPLQGRGGATRHARRRHLQERDVRANLADPLRQRMVGALGQRVADHVFAVSRCGGGADVRGAIASLSRSPRLCRRQSEERRVFPVAAAADRDASV